MNKKIILILTSIILSIIIWGSVSLSGYFVTKIKVPVRVINLPEGYIVGSATVKEVIINLKGEGWRILSLLWGNKPYFIIPINNGDDHESVILKEAIKENDWLSYGVQVYDIYPASFKYKVERMKEKRIKIYPDVKLNFKSEFGLVSKISLLPDTVTVYGTKFILSELDSIPTVIKEYDDLEFNVEDKIDIQQNEDIKYSNKTVTINFEVQKIVDKTFDDLEVSVINIPNFRDVTLFPNKISIVLRGGINNLSKLSNSDFQPYIDYQTLIMDTTGTVEPIINLIGYSKLIDIKPKNLKYIIKKF